MQLVHLCVCLHSPARNESKSCVQSYRMVFMNCLWCTLYNEPGRYKRLPWRQLAAFLTVRQYFQQIGQIIHCRASTIEISFDIAVTLIEAELAPWVHTSLTGFLGSILAIAPISKLNIAQSHFLARVR